MKTKISWLSLIFLNILTPRLKGYFVKIGCSETQAEEIIQEVMIAVWTKSNTYDREKSSVSTWIYTIAKNKVDKIRKEKKHNTVESDESLEIPVPSKQEQQILSTEVSEKIRHSLKFYLMSRQSC